MRNDRALLRYIDDYYYFKPSVEIPHYVIYPTAKAQYSNQALSTESLYSHSHLVVISYLVMQLLCESSWNESLSWIYRCSASGPSDPSPASQAARHPASQAASYCGQNRRPGYMMHGIRAFYVVAIYVRAPVLTVLLWKRMGLPFAVKE